MLLFQHAAQASRGTTAVRMEAIELTAHYQYNLSWSSKTTEATFSVCSALFTDASAQNNNNMLTARLPPNRCSANICTRPAVRVEKDGGMDFPARAYTHKHAQTPPSVVCSHAVSHLSVF